LLQTVDGNPVANLRVSGIAANGNYNFAIANRVNPVYGVIRQRANTANSIYHALQVSLEKRFSRSLALGAHYTWSAFIDTASEVFNAAVNGDVAVAQDSFNRRSDRARSTYDRPHRFSLTHVYQIPYHGPLAPVLSGWQVNGSLAFQSGAPFDPLNGTDPFLRLSGIDSLVGNAIRPDLAPGASLAGKTIDQLYPNGNKPFILVAPTPARMGVLTVGQVIPVDSRMVGNVGRNTLRGDGIAQYDFGMVKNVKFTEKKQLQVRADFFNLTNSRNFGIPESRVNSANFLNQWGQDGGNRRIQLGTRLSF
jgi:hypothetical protein